MATPPSLFLATPPAAAAAPPPPPPPPPPPSASQMTPPALSFTDVPLGSANAPPSFFAAPAPSPSTAPAASQPQQQQMAGGPPVAAHALLNQAFGEPTTLQGQIAKGMATSMLGSVQQRVTSVFGIFSLDFLRPYFAVDGQEVGRRIGLCFVPIKDKAFTESPELYGPTIGVFLFAWLFHLLSRTEQGGAVAMAISVWVFSALVAYAVFFVFNVQIDLVTCFSVTGYLFYPFSVGALLSATSPVIFFFGLCAVITLACCSLCFNVMAVDAGNCQQRFLGGVLANAVPALFTFILYVKLL